MVGIVIGAENETSFEIMKKLYEPFIRNSYNYVLMDLNSAEMTKYAANAMLATKISFMNELAGICDETGVNINEVRKFVERMEAGEEFMTTSCCAAYNELVDKVTANNNTQDSRVRNTAKKQSTDSLFTKSSETSDKILSDIELETYAP